MGQRPAAISRGNPDRHPTVAAVRCDRDVVVGHGADAERVNRAHRIENAPVQRHSMPGVPVGEGIGADDPLAIEHDKVAVAELLEERLDRCLAQPHTPGERFWGRG